MTNDIFEMVKQIKADPFAVLSKRFNLPQGLSKDPGDILQYLLNSGQVSQAQVNNAMSMRKMFMK